jgi:membrane fusion protein (multidrug efflux system)
MKNLFRILIIFMAGALVASCDSTTGSGESGTAVEKKVQPVRVVPLSYQEASVLETVTSTVVAFEETYLSPALQGRIRSVKVEVNDHVQKGQLLAEMDRTQLEQTRLQLQTLQTDLARMDTLLKTGSVTQQSYDQMKSQVETIELVLENLEENTLLRAPYAGIITGKYYSDGELFSPAPNTQAGKAALVSMIQIDPVKLMVNLGEEYLPLVRTGMQANVKTDVYPDHPFQGTVFRIHPTVNPATRTFVVEVKVPNKNEKLRPGMFARVSLKLGENEALMVPAIAVLQTSGTNERYIMLNEDGKARKVVVNIEKRYDDKLAISSPSIQGGEQLIIAGHTNLENGDPVKVVEE